MKNQKHVRTVDKEKPTKRPTNTDPTPTYGGLDLWHGAINYGHKLHILR